MPDIIATPDAAVERLATQGGPTILTAAKKIAKGKQLPTGDLLKMAEALSNATATAEAAGRASLRKQLPGYESFSEWSAFAETLTPEGAIKWFRSRYPASRVNPQVFPMRHEGQGFQLAVTTEQTIRDRVAKLVAEGLAKGTDETQAIKEALDSAGVGVKPWYPRLVFRTNVMEAYRRGGWEEFQDPDVADYFPVWEYMGIADGRERDAHHAHFGKYFPRDVDFFLVRGDGPANICNCRCLARAISRPEWDRLQKQGARLAQ